MLPPNKQLYFLHLIKWILFYVVFSSTCILTCEHNMFIFLPHGHSYAVRQGLLDGVQRAGRDLSITAVIITGAGQAFCGGADITEFSGQMKGWYKLLQTVITQDPQVISIFMGEHFKSFRSSEHLFQNSLLAIWRKACQQLADGLMFLQSSAHFNTSPHNWKYRCAGEIFLSAI